MYAKWRGMNVPTSGGSQLLKWLDAKMTAPLFGTFSAPVTFVGKITE